MSTSSESTHSKSTRSKSARSKSTRSKSTQSKSTRSKSTGRKSNTSKSTASKATRDQSVNSQPTESTASTSTTTWRDRWQRLRQTDWWHIGLVALPAYIVSRLCVLAGAAIVAAELRVDANLAAEPGSNLLPDVHGPINTGSAIRPMVDVLTSWDGKWYMDIVRKGYPRSVPPNISYFDAEARAAFFPTFPTLARWFDYVLPGGDVAAALILNLLLGLIAVVMVGVLASRIFTPRIGRLTALVVAVFPGSFVFSFAYSEALMMVLAAAAMLALWEQRWVLAGVLAAFTTATRPNGVAIVVACAVAAYPAVVKRHQWRALAAPLLAPVGFIVFQWWVGAHADERGVWFRVQREAWDEGASFGWTAVRNTFEAFARPLTSPTDTITALTVIATVWLVWATVKAHLPRFLSAYAIVVLALMLAPATVTARPRFLFTAFPLLIGAAWWFDRWRQRHDDDILTPLVYVACGAGLVALTGLYGVYGAIP